jgi:hypothetical protein
MSGSRRVAAALLSLTMATTPAAAAEYDVPSPCRILPAREVAHAIGLDRLQSVDGRTRYSRGVVAPESPFRSCAYKPGPTVHLPAANFDIFDLGSRPAAKREYDAQIEMAETNGDPRRRRAGPWDEGYQFGNLQMYVLIGANILQFHFVETAPQPTQSYPRGAVRKAVTAAARAFRRRSR